jgi:predicted transcriptional regulator of viral defense system
MATATHGYSISGSTRAKRSDVGLDLVRLLASEGHRIFSIDLAREFSSQVELKEPYLAEALYHLRRNGWIIPLRRGLYAISVPGAQPIHEFEIAMELVHPAAISHWSAMHHHGLTEQIPRRVFVSTTQASVPRVAARATRRSAGRPVGGATYQFVQVKPEHFFGAEHVWIGEARVTITDVERTLLDGLSMPRYCGDFAEVLHAFEVRAAHLDLDKITGYALRLGGTIAKRLGWVLEKQGVGLDRLLLLQQAPLKGYRKLDPSGPRQGPYNSRWTIQENLPGKPR